MKITLRAARVNSGLTLIDSSNRLGVNKDTLSKYEKDSTDIPRSLLAKLEDQYHVNTNDIFFGIESEFFRTKNEGSERI